MTRYNKHALIAGRPHHLRTVACRRKVLYKVLVTDSICCHVQALLVTLMMHNVFRLASVKIFDRSDHADSTDGLFSISRQGMRML